MASTTLAATDTTAPADTTDTTPTGSAPPLTVVPESGLATVPTEASCAFTSAPAGDGSVTFTKGGKLFELVPGATTARCVAPLGSAVSADIAWSPDGTRALIGGQQVVADGAVHPTGFAADDGAVTWSYPTGKALIAPSNTTGALTWRSSSNPTQTRDVSFLAQTDVAAYHPAGKDIIAAGTSKDGVRGMFIASNRGENVRTLATLNDASTKITEIVASPDNFVYFVHDHGTYQELHSLQLPGLMLTTLVRGEAGETLSHFTVGARGAAVAVGNCSTSMRVWGTTLTDDLAAIPARSVMPVGWLGSTLAVVARSQGCSGPADVWLVNAESYPFTATRVLQGVDQVSVRSVLSTYQEVPGDINAQAPG